MIIPLKRGTLKFVRWHFTEKKTRAVLLPYLKQVIMFTITMYNKARSLKRFSNYNSTPLWVFELFCTKFSVFGLTAKYNATWTPNNVAITNYLTWTFHKNAWALQQKKDHTTHVSLAIVSGKWLFAWLTWPVLRPGFRRWWPLFAVGYPLCLAVAGRETAAF